MFRTPRRAARFASGARFRSVLAVEVLESRSLPSAGLWANVADRLNQIAGIPLQARVEAVGNDLPARGVAASASTPDIGVGYVQQLAAATQGFVMDFAVVAREVTFTFIGQMSHLADRVAADLTPDPAPVTAKNGGTPATPATDAANERGTPPTTVLAEAVGARAPALTLVAPGGVTDGTLARPADQTGPAAGIGPNRQALVIADLPVGAMRPLRPAESFKGTNDTDELFPTDEGVARKLLKLVIPVFADPGPAPAAEPAPATPDAPPAVDPLPEACDTCFSEDGWADLSPVPETAVPLPGLSLEAGLRTGALVAGAMVGAGGWRVAPRIDRQARPGLRAKGRV